MLHDYYVVLGVSVDATVDVIKTAYRKLVLDYHPDTLGDVSPRLRELATQKFKEVTEAYTLLSDPEKRREYDRMCTHEAAASERNILLQEIQSAVEREDLLAAVDCARRLHERFPAEDDLLQVYVEQAYDLARQLAEEGDLVAAKEYFAVVATLAKSEGLRRQALGDIAILSSRMGTSSDSGTDGSSAASHSVVGATAESKMAERIPVPFASARHPVKLAAMIAMWACLFLMVMATLAKRGNLFNYHGTADTHVNVAAPIPLALPDATVEPVPKIDERHSEAPLVDNNAPMRLQPDDPAGFRVVNSYRLLQVDEADLAVSPDGCKIALVYGRSPSSFGEVESVATLWDVQTDRHVTLFGDGGNVKLGVFNKNDRVGSYAPRFNADGTKLVLPARDRLLIWNLGEMESYVGVAWRFLEPMSDEARVGGAPNGGYSIQGVVPDSPASLAGIQQGDVITDVQYKDAFGSNHECKYGVGTKLPIHIMRKGAVVETQLTVGERPCLLPQIKMLRPPLPPRNCPIVLPNSDSFQIHSFDACPAIGRLAVGLATHDMAARPSPDDIVRMFRSDSETVDACGSVKGEGTWQTGNTPCAMCFGSDGKLLFVARETIEIVDGRTGAIMGSLPGHVNRPLIVALATNHDASTLASAGMDGKVVLWDVSTRRELRSLAVCELNSAPVGHMFFSAKGDRLVTVGNDEQIRIWNTQTGALECRLQNQHGRVIAIAPSPDGTWFVSASEDGTVEIWGTTQVVGHKDPIRPSSMLNNHEMDAAGVSAPSEHRTPVSDSSAVVAWNVTKAPASTPSLPSPTGSTKTENQLQAAAALVTTGNQYLARQDYANAIVAFRKSADQDDALAQNALGEMYQAGQGTSWDCAEARKWYTLAANQGLASAQRNLGIIYWKGLSVQTNQELGMEWLRKAAEQGDTKAQKFIRASDKELDFQDHFAQAKSVVDGLPSGSEKLSAAQKADLQIGLKDIQVALAYKPTDPAALAIRDKIDSYLNPAKELTLDLGNNVTMKLSLIPSGKFNMGSPVREKGRGVNEGPQHEVSISKAYYMGIYVVTQEQYEQVMGKNPSYFVGAQRPVEMVSWHNAVEFCNRVSQKTGKRVCLPTEAQWEYACRAGTQTRFSYGDDDDRLGEYAWYARNGGETTHAVGQKKPNGWGLYDMHGNAWEWCADWFTDSYANSNTDPQGPVSGTHRVLRGGSIGALGVPQNCRCATRFRNVPATFGDTIGFRVVVDLE